jgi:CHAT domain-containing protein
VLPSFGVLAQIRSRPRTVRNPVRLALVGDPVYGLDDERLGSRSRQLPRPKSRFERLGSAEDELIDIARAAGAGVQMLTGFDAAVKRIEGHSLARFDIIHFATHAEVNGRRPELSRLVLSQLDAAGHEVDGSFRLVDVYSLKLNARMVVLSACETAAGRNLRGEGVMSMTRGFLSAGASSVISSLWLVADNAAAALMRNVYTSMLQRGVPPAEALRLAQNSIRRQRRWQGPYFWAPFVLQGEWR